VVVRLSWSFDFHSSARFQESRGWRGIAGRTAVYTLAQCWK
jgi:hypothetical protein